MTPDEYRDLLKALAAKHIRAPRFDQNRPPFHDGDQWLHLLDDVSALARLANAVAADRRQDEQLLHVLRRRLAEESPVELATSMMDEVGILDALDDAQSLVFGNFSRSAVPEEDIELLRRAGFSNAEIEVLLALAVEYAHKMAEERNKFGRWSGPRGPLESTSEILEDAVKALREATEKLGQVPEPPKKKRKLFNGIGKLLGGSVMGIGNALVATGTILAPNPATGSIAIASGAGAVVSMMAGIGDLRGE